MGFIAGGLGLVMAPATEAIMGSLPAEKAGVGSAVNDTTRELGGTLGVAILGSLFASAYGAKLVDLLSGTPLPPEALAAAKESVGAAVRVTAEVDRAIRSRGRCGGQARRRHRLHGRLPRRHRGSPPAWSSSVR